MTTSPHGFMDKHSTNVTGSRSPRPVADGAIDSMGQCADQGDEAQPRHVSGENFDTFPARTDVGELQHSVAYAPSSSMGDEDFDLDLRDEGLGDDRIFMAENSDAVCKPSDTPGCFTDMGKACSHDFGCDVITKKDPACGVTQTGGPTCHHQCPTEHGNTCAMTCVSPTCRHTCATCAGTCPETCDTCAATDCVADTCVDC